MSRNKNYQRPNFFRSHADTIAIMAVNLAIAAILITMIISNSHRIDAANVRSDTIQTMIYQESKDFHSRLCAIEERNKK